MKRRASGLALAATLLAGCTTTRQIQRPQTLEQFAPRVSRNRGAITLLYERPEGARSPVPPALVAPAEGPRAGDEGAPVLDLLNLRGYEVKRRGLGSLEGLGVGILLGALVGAAIGAGMGSDQPCNGMDGCNLSFSGSDKALALGFVGALGGFLVGPPIGLLIGHTDRYVFTTDGAQP